MPGRTGGADAGADGVFDEDALEWRKVDEPLHAGFEMDEAGFADLEEIDGDSVDVVETAPGVWEIRPKVHAAAAAAANVVAPAKDDTAPAAASAAKHTASTSPTAKQLKRLAQVKERQERKRQKQRERKAKRKAEREAAVAAAAAGLPVPTLVPASAAGKKRKRPPANHNSKTKKTYSPVSIAKYEKALRKKLKAIAALKQKVEAQDLVPNAEQAAKLAREDELQSELLRCVNGTLLKEGTASAASAATTSTDSDTDNASHAGEWSNMGLDTRLTDNLLAMDFRRPTDIQRSCLPIVLHKRRDLIAAAKTGSGKTLAFGLPLLQMIMWRTAEQRQAEPLSALILTPTRELAMQVKSHIDAAAKGTGVTTAAIVGGISEEKQTRLLNRRPDIVVGTCGRLWIHISQGHPHLSQLHRLRFFVLDEADRMLDKGHYAELNKIVLQVTRTREEDVVEDEDVTAMDEDDEAGEQEQARAAAREVKRQTLLFSATMMLGSEDRRTAKLNKKKRKRMAKAKSTTSMLHELMTRVGARGTPQIVDFTRKDTTAGSTGGGGDIGGGDDCNAAGGTKRQKGPSSPSSSSSSSSSGVGPSLPEGLELARIECTQEDKDLYLYYFLSFHKGRTIIFANSIAVVRKLSQLLKIMQLPAYPLHAQMQQRQRLKNMDRFRSSKHCILIASDVAARGLDVPNVDHVVHYNIARTPEIFIHRSGRTARANTRGLALSLVSPHVEERRAFDNACRTLRLSRDDIVHLEVNMAYMPHVRTRVKLGKRLRTETEKNSREASDALWFKQQAEAADIVLDEAADEVDGVFRRKESTLEQRLRAELTEMLSTPLTGRGVSGSRKYAHGR